MGVQDWQPSKIKKSHVLQAAGIWDARHAHGGSDHPFLKHSFRNSNHFDVLIGGRPYPPKAIASCAHGLATGQYLPTSGFAGAKDGLWHRRLKALGFQVVEKKLRNPVHVRRERGPAKSIEEDINDILSSTHLPATKRKALIEARIGQGRFRMGVLKRWNQGCAVTGCTALEALRASHIKPWRTCDDQERLDPENGLPLIATLDALFDRHLVSFNDDGLILISNALDDELSALGINRKMRIKGRLTPRQKALLAEHRRHLA